MQDGESRSFINNHEAGAKICFIHVSHERP